MFDKAATFYPPPEEEEEKFPPGGGGNDTVSKVIGYGMRGVLAVNSDDDDLDGVEDRSQPGPVAGEDDLIEIRPVPGCCSCLEHSGDVHHVRDARA